MELARQRRLPFRLPAFSVPIQLPLYVRLMLSVWLSMLILVAGVLLLSRLTRPATRSYAPFADIFRSDDAQRRRSDCNDAVFLPGDALVERAAISEDYRECTYVLDSRPFSQILVTSFSVNFTVRENAPLLGDIAQWWGRPEIVFTGSTTVSLHWREAGIIAHARPVNGQYSYFSPLTRIFFADLDWC
jgi:hypothetical protein